MGSPGRRPDRARPDRLPTWAKGRTERRCADIVFAHVGKVASGADAEAVAPDERARRRSRAPPDPTRRPARHRPPRSLPRGVGGDPPGGVPARPLEVPGLWPWGRPRGPPRRQARPGGLGLRSRPPGGALSAVPRADGCALRTRPAGRHPARQGALHRRPVRHDEIVATLTHHAVACGAVDRTFCPSISLAAVPRVHPSSINSAARSRSFSCIAGCRTCQ